jgi:hypothetical protein
MSGLARRVRSLENTVSPSDDEAAALATLGRLFPGVDFAARDAAAIDHCQALIEVNLAKTDLDQAAAFRAHRLGYVVHGTSKPATCQCAFCEMRRALGEEAASE